MIVDFMNSRESSIPGLPVAICAAIGVVMTILVAWGIAAFVTPQQGAVSRPSGIGHGWSYWLGRDFGTVRIARVPAWFELKEPLREEYLAVRTRMVPSWSAVHSSSQGATSYFAETAQGWPLPALRSETEITNNTNGAPTITVHWAAVTGAGMKRQPEGTVLPLRPIWSGFIIDSLLFGALAWIVMFMPSAVRRKLRRRGGRCVHCGYDLRGLRDERTCPECGVRGASASEVGGATGGATVDAPAR